MHIYILLQYFNVANFTHTKCVRKKALSIYNLMASPLNLNDIHTKKRLNLPYLTWCLVDVWSLAKRN